MKRYTHTGTVVNYNYGKPIRRNVDLRETANFWVTETGIKYRKASGSPAGADMWNQNRLILETVKPKPVEVSFKHVGYSFDGRANKWQVDCPYCKRKVNPKTTMLAHQNFECDCGTQFSADWNTPSVKVKQCP